MFIFGLVLGFACGLLLAAVVWHLIEILEERIERLDGEARHAEIEREVSAVESDFYE